MFDFIRTHQRLMQFVLLLLIFPSFVFFGLEGYTRFRDDGNAVAVVGKQSITQQDFENIHRENIERMRQMTGGKIETKFLDTPEAKQRTLDTLINEQVVALEAAKSNVRPNAQQIDAEKFNVFPQLADNELTPENRYKLYSQLVGEQGMSVRDFEARLTNMMLQKNLIGSVQAAAFAPKTVANRLSDINAEQRDVQQLLFKAADYVSKVQVTDAMLKDFYAKNGSLFAIPEQARAEYVVLDSAAIAAQISVSDDDVKKHYEQNKKRFSVEEQRRASHILITVNKKASDADKAAAKAKAEKLLAEARKTPSAFAKLAKENSQDPGSAEKGGDLGFFGTGAMVKPFEDAVYNLKDGEISDLVQSDFGYHIIQLTGIKAGSVKPFEEVKAELTTEIKNQLAAKKFTESAEIFRDTVEDQADSLKPVADKLKLKVEAAANLTRQPNPSVAPNAPYNDAKFLTALFADDAVKNKRNTLAIQLGPNTLIAGHVVEHKPATQKPFEEVKAIIRERVVQQEAAKLAKQAGEAKLAALKTKDDAAGFGEVKKVSRTKTEGMDPVGFEAVMKADSTKLPAYASAEFPQQGFAVYRVVKVEQPATPDVAKRQTERQQIDNLVGAQETYAYLEMLKQKAKVKLLKPVGSKADGEDKQAQ